MPAVVSPVKASTGPGVGFFGSGSPLMGMDRTPQAVMKRAQMAYHVNPWIGTAEAVVTRKVVGLPWHLEDGNDEEYPDDGSAPEDVRGARLLLERPQFLLPGNARKPGTQTRRLMWSITTRHLGLCGMAFWFGDMIDNRGIPTAWLYVNPARMTPAEDDNGNLVGWVLDAQDAYGHGGTPLQVEEVLPFYLDAPDSGNMGTGIYERAVLKAQITSLADQHAAYVLSTGGRIAGIVSPREGVIPDEQFKNLVAEFRNVNEAPDAAKRTTIMQGPTDFTPTAADPSQLNLVELAKLNRDDVFTIWGVPGSQAPVAMAAGLNSGQTKGFDEAILMQGAVHDRVVAIRETIQFGWLDRYLPTVIELEFEEPDFDDTTPAFERLQRAVAAPLTNAERREIVGLPPTGDPAIDDAIVLPVTSAVWATVGTALKATNATVSPMAAGMHASLSRLRSSLDQRAVPHVEHSMSGFLDEQRREITDRIRANMAHIVSHPNDDSVWWNGEKWDRELKRTLQPDLVQVAQTVSEHVSEILTP